MKNKVLFFKHFVRDEYMCGYLSAKPDIKPADFFRALFGTKQEKQNMLKEIQDRRFLYTGGDYYLDLEEETAEKLYGKILDGEYFRELFKDQLPTPTPNKEGE